MINNSSSVALFQVRDDGIFSVPGIAGGSLASLTADVKSTGFRLASGGTYAFSSSATDAYNNAVDTGLSRIAAGVVGVGNGIATSPTGTLVAGNLSVGSTTPWGLLSVAAQAPGSQSPLFVVASSTPSATTTAFIITASNQVGIGTTTPWGLLSIAGGAGATIPLLAVSSSSASGATATVFEIDQNGNITATPNNATATFGSSGTTGFNTLTVNGILTENATANLEMLFNSTNNFLLGDNVALNDDNPAGQQVNLFVNDGNNNAVMSVKKSGTGIGDIFDAQSSTGVEAFDVKAFGNVLVGTSSTSNINGATFYITASTSNSTTLPLFTVATSTGASLFSVNNIGGVSMPSLVSGNTGDYVCDNGGVIENAATPCSISSEKVKNSIDALNSDAGLSAILKLNPVTFRYDKGFGDSGAAVQVGLIAEPTAAVNPLFAEYATAPMQTPNGTIEVGQPDGINWEAITSATVLAIQEQQRQIDALQNGVPLPRQSDEDDYLWGAIGVLVIWNLYLTFRRK